MSLQKFPGFFLNFSERDMEESKGDSYCFGKFRLDLPERRLSHHDNHVPLTPKAFEILSVLVERAGHLVEKEELMERVWPDTFVEEANVARIVYTLRKALGDDGNGNGFIQTIPKKGYRFVAPVTELNCPAGQVSTPAEPAPARDAARPDENDQAAENPEPDAVVSRPTGRGELVRKIAVAAGAIAAFLAVVWLFFGSGSVSGGGSDEPKSIAVLPVESLTDQGRDSIYELGIAESLIARLGSAKNLKVRQLDAVRKYVGVEKDAAAVGREQRVDYVLASSYQVADRKIRITSQLIDVSTGSVDDVIRFDGDRSDPFLIQDVAATYIGNSVLRRLDRQAGNVSTKRYTTSEEAYRLYQLGTTLADSRDPTAFPEAVANFEKAVRLDPNYALAYAGLANAHTAMSLAGEEKGAYEYFTAKEAIEKALQLDDSLSEAHTYLGELKWGKEWDFAGAEREFRRGIELNPNSSAVHRMYALMLGMLGRTDEAVNEIKTAIDLEPASVLNHKLFAKILYHGRRYDDAIAEGRLAFVMAPNSGFSIYDLIDANEQKGDYDQAFEWFMRYRNLAGDSADEIEAWKKVYSNSGWRGVQEREIDLANTGRLVNKSGSYPPLAIARIYAVRGERERAFEYIEKAFAIRQWGIVKLKTDPAFDPLRSDPRFEEMLRRANLN